MIEEDIVFKGYEVDANSRVRASSFLRRMQQIAGDDLDQYGLGYEAMRQDDIIFILSKIRLKFFDHAESREKLRLMTYAREVHGVSFYRDFEAFRGENQLAVGASRWALINYKTRRIERPQVLQHEIPVNAERFHGFDVQHLALPEGAQLIKSDYRPVYASMLDENNHLNNCVYADIATDYLPDKKCPVREIQLDFHREALLGEILFIQTYAIEGGIFVRGTFRKDGAVCFESEIFTF